MKQIVASLLLLLLFTDVNAQNTFVRGADISWCTEMEASGRTFQNAQGQEMELCRSLSIGRITPSPDLGHSRMPKVRRWSYAPY